MKFTDSKRPWMIELAPGDFRKNQGKNVADIIVEVARKKCNNVSIKTTHEFSSFAKERGLEFKCTEIYCTFFFKNNSGNHNIRVCTKIWNNLEDNIFFSFEKGELGGSGYGTDWVRQHYLQMAKQDFFREAYEEFISEIASKIQGLGILITQERLDNNP